MWTMSGRSEACVRDSPLSEPHRSNGHGDRAVSARGRGKRCGLQWRGPVNGNGWVRSEARYSPKAAQFWLIPTEVWSNSAPTRVQHEYGRSQAKASRTKPKHNLLNPIPIWPIADDCCLKSAIILAETIPSLVDPKFVQTQRSLGRVQQSVDRSRNTVGRAQLRRLRPRPPKTWPNSHATQQYD